MQKPTCIPPKKWEWPSDLLAAVIYLRKNHYSPWESYRLLPEDKDEQTPAGS